MSIKTGTAPKVTVARYVSHHLCHLLASLLPLLETLEGRTNKAIIIKDNRSPLAWSHTSSQTTSSSLSTTERSSKTRQHASLFREVSHMGKEWKY
jgi:hypothetical protein